MLDRSEHLKHSECFSDSVGVTYACFIVHLGVSYSTKIIHVWLQVLGGTAVVLKRAIDMHWISLPIMVVPIQRTSVSIY